MSRRDQIETRLGQLEQANERMKAEIQRLGSQLRRLQEGKADPAQAATDRAIVEQVTKAADKYLEIEATKPRMTPSAKGGSIMGESALDIDAADDELSKADAWYETQKACARHEAASGRTLSRNFAAKFAAAIPHAATSTAAVHVTPYKPLGKRQP